MAVEGQRGATHSTNATRTSRPGSAEDHFSGLIGVRVLLAGPGEGVAELHAGPEHANDLGIVHGGAIASLIDVAVAAAANSQEAVRVSIGLSIAFLKGASPGERLVARAQAQHEGRRLAGYSAEVRSAGRLIATAIAQAVAIHRGLDGMRPCDQEIYRLGVDTPGPD